MTTTPLLAPGTAGVDPSAEKIATTLADLIELPGEIEAAVEHVRKVRALNPWPNRTRNLATELTEAYYTLDTKRAEKLAAEKAVLPDKRTAWSHALDRAQRDLRAAITANGDALIVQIRERHVQPLLDAFHTAAVITPANALELLRAGRDADARLVADMPVTHADLLRYWRLRDSIAPRADFGGSLGHGCENTTHPHLHVPGTSPEGHARQPHEMAAALIQAGGSLWYPTPGEAYEHAKDIHTEQQRAKEEAQAHKPKRTVFV